MKKYKLLILALALLSTTTFAQVSTGFFGGDAAASGFPNHGNTQNMWIKLGELTLNGPYNAAGILVDLYPKNANHGDAREQMSVQLRNTDGSNGGGIYQTTYDIALVHFHGQHHTIKDVKVIHTAGSGIINNELSIWVQMGISWLNGIPIEVRTYGNATVYTTNQPYYSSIPETGTVYEKNTNYALKGDKLDFSGTIRSKEVLVEAGPWPDYVFSNEYQLKSLSEVSTFISENGHLPNIPSAAEVAINGIELGKMNASLLEKIEELTLYTIDQQEEISIQQLKLARQENKISDQETKLKKQETLIQSLIERIEKLEK